MSDKVLRVFIGYDPRQSISYNVLQYSILKNASRPVAITPLVLETLPLNRVGLTPFTYSRFLVPYLTNYQGKALFLDSDMLVLGDIAELFDMMERKYAVMVCKNKKKFEWASVMLFNGSECKNLTPEFVEKGKGMHGLECFNEGKIGALPSTWNHLVGYDPECSDPKLIHYTQGNPCFPETSSCEHTEIWHHYHQEMNAADNWQMLMGPSVHAFPYGRIKLPKFMMDESTGRIKPQYDSIANSLRGQYEQTKSNVSS